MNCVVPCPGPMKIVGFDVFASIAENNSKIANEAKPYS